MDGWKVPGYTEIRDLGAGAQGRVVLARDDDSGGFVAIKYLAAAGSATDRERALFRREAATLARVSDVNVARLLSYVETPDGAAMVMEAVNGIPLRAVLEHEKSLKPESALAVLKGSLLGLAAAHAVGIVHRDYKPGNVLVEPSGQSKLIDFGIAVLTGFRSRSGTPAYMAPEQWLGSEATPATDVYAATCVFFEAVTGRRPFGGGDTTTVMEGHLQRRVPARRVPKPLRGLVQRGMAKEAADRPAGAAAFVVELEDAATAAYGSDWERRGWAALGLAAIAVGIALPLAAVGTAVGLAVRDSSAHLVHGMRAARTLHRVARSKVTAGVAAGTAAGAAAVWVWWPTPAKPPPPVGGVSVASYSVGFERPGVLLDNASVPDGSPAGPYWYQSMRVAPSRVRAGTTVQMLVEWKSDDVWGLEYRPGGKLRCHESKAGAASEGRKDLVDAFHRGYGFQFGGVWNATPKNEVFVFAGASPDGARLPVTPGRAVAGIETQTATGGNYDYTRCAFVHTVTDTVTFTVPTDGSVRPGRYVVSAYDKPGDTMIRVTRKGHYPVTVTPAAVGETQTGSFPTMTVMPK